VIDGKVELEDVL